MSDFLDHLPTHEQKRLKRMMSAAAYEQLREKVKGPEDLKEELKKGEQLAEVHFLMESNPEAGETSKQLIERDLKENPSDVIDHSEKLNAETLAALKEGKFTVSVRPHPVTKEDALVLLPEGTVHEAIPLKPSYQESSVASLLSKDSDRK